MKPAENATLAVGGLTGVIAAATGAQTDLAIALWAVGALPHVVTFLVDNGGLSGAARTLWRGRQR